MTKPKKRNRAFVEWYENIGCGRQNCIGKTEEEKLEIAFVEGMKVALTCLGFYRKSIKKMLMAKEK